MGIYKYRLSSPALVKQLAKEKENSEFKAAVILLKIDRVLLFVVSEGLVIYKIGLFCIYLHVNI